MGTCILISGSFCHQTVLAVCQELLITIPITFFSMGGEMLWPHNIIGIVYNSIVYNTYCLAVYSVHHVDDASSLHHVDDASSLLSLLSPLLASHCCRCFVIAAHCSS